jgi:hypothetical protein
MKVVWSLAAMLAVAVLLSLSAADPAGAWCGWRCRGLVPVPTPVITPAPVAVVPPPNPIPLPFPAWFAGPRAAYPAYGYSPVAYGGCFAGPGNCYWRRDCWYDAFGRRFCN